MKSPLVKASFLSAFLIAPCLTLPGRAAGDDAAAQHLQSPDGKLSVSVFVAQDGRLSYGVRDGAQEILAPSPLGVTVDGVDLGDQVKLGTATTKTVEQAYPVVGKHSVAKTRANEANIPVSSHDRSYTLQVHVQDDGVAVRYVLPEGTKHVDGESTAWSIADAKNAAWQDWSQCYEGEDHWSAWGQVPENKRISGLITVETPGHFLFLTEADNANYPDFCLQRAGGTIKPAWYAQPKGFDVQSKEQATTPWRVTIVGRDLSTLVNSDMLTSLCPPPQPNYDFSFSKPGRILWQWCSVGAPKLDDQKDWYDATAKLGWEYYMIDDGWRNWRKDGKDQWALLKEVIDYGKSKGVPTFIWVDSKELIRSPEARHDYLQKVVAAGAVGIKIDFIPNASDKIMAWYDDTLRETAELKLMTIFHGCTKPTGRERTWPHGLTREGIRGNEYQMTRYHRVQRMDHDVIQPFTRFLAGAGDITPMVADPAQLGQFTAPHMFAQAIVSTSPWLCFYDQYKFYIGSKVEDLLKDLPCAWDETRVLPCSKIGEVAAFARRKGKVWWLGVENGGQPAKVSVPLNFLTGKAQATLVEDGPEQADLNRSEKNLAPNDTLTLDLRAGGGFVGRFAPQG
jgi:alpha-glucosidase